jgi:hypothetical protein
LKGQQVQVVSVGGSAAAEVDGRTCMVTVTGIRGTTVGLTGNCE